MSRAKPQQRDSEGKLVRPEDCQICGWGTFQFFFCDSPNAGGEDKACALCKEIWNSVPSLTAEQVAQVAEFVDTARGNDFIKVDVGRE